MLSERYSIAMAELLHYLKGIKEEDVNKIPSRLIELFKLNSSKNYNCNFDYTQPLKELKLKDETRGLIAMICLNYWCETEEQKNNFLNHLNQNEKRYQEELQKKYSIDNIFKQNNLNTKNESINKKIDENKLPLQIKKENIIKRIFNYILNFLKKDY